MNALPIPRHRGLGYVAAALILLTALVPLGGDLWAGGGGSEPQRYALGENPALIWMHLITNLLIGLAYVAISGTLIHLTRKTGRRIPFLWAFVAFGVFIISCGATHFMAALTLWEPVYWMAGGVLWITALARSARRWRYLPWSRRSSTSWRRRKPPRSGAGASRRARSTSGTSSVISTWACC